MNKCKIFPALVRKCKSIFKKVSYLVLSPNFVTLYANKLDPDIDVAVYIPEDNDLFPCQVHSNGNCLPLRGSIFAYGHSGKTAEIRVK
jgi:hypothetical protein